MEPYILVPPRPTTAKEIRTKMYFYIKAAKNKERHVNYLAKKMENAMVVYNNTAQADGHNSDRANLAKREYQSYINHYNRESDILEEIEYGVYYWKKELDSFNQFAA